MLAAARGIHDKPNQDVANLAGVASDLSGHLGRGFEVWGLGFRVQGANCTRWCLWKDRKGCNKACSPKIA